MEQKLIDKSVAIQTLCDGQPIMWQDIIIRLLERVPTIDPIHAAGGCYCGECIFAKPFPSDVKPVLCGNGQACRKNTTDFCSYGERSDQNA